MPVESSLGAIRTTHGEVRAVLVAPSGERYDLEALSGGALPSEPGALLALANWDHRIADLAPEESARIEGDLVAPQPRPTKIVAVGLNYVDHSEESGAESPEQPLLFAKWPNGLIGPGGTIRVPTAMTAEADYEVELAAVIARTAVGVSPDQALDYIGGYTIANDVSARDVQFREVQWTFGKSFDTFCPLGPTIVPRAAIADVQALQIETEINGEKRQSASTADMVFSVATLVSYISAHVTLVPGDLILTGTPAGVGLGFNPPRWLADGDVVTCSVEGIGSLTNPVELVGENGR